MNIGVIGSRSITEYEPVRQSIWSSPWFDSQGMTPPEKWGYTLVSGGADGVDSCAAEFADQVGIPIETIEPDWDDWSDGHPALSRNTTIVEKSDAIIAVWDGVSNGTRDSIDKALDRGVPIYVEVVQ